MKAILNKGYLLTMVVVLLATTAGCKKEETPKVDIKINDADYVLVIENGAFGLGFDESVTLTAYLLGPTGIVAPESI